MSKRKPNKYLYYKKLSNIKKKRNLIHIALKEKLGNQEAQKKYKAAFKEWLANKDYTTPKPTIEQFLNH
jgi:hypothetical protein